MGLTIKNSIKTLSLFLSVLMLLSSCSVYRPTEVDKSKVTVDNGGFVVDNSKKKVYLRVIDQPDYVMIFSDIKDTGFAYEGNLTKNAVKIDEEYTSEIWVDSVSKIVMQDNGIYAVNKSDIIKIETYQHSKKASFMHSAAIGFGVALVAFVVYLGVTY